MRQIHKEAEPNYRFFTGTGISFRGKEKLKKTNQRERKAAFRNWRVVAERDRGIQEEMHSACKGKYQI